MTSWQAHHLVPESAKAAEEARRLLKDEFKIDINSVANGLWSPKQKGEVFIENVDWDGVTTVQLATHNGRHTNTYSQYVTDKLQEAFDRYGPDGLNYNQVALTNEGVKVLHEIRKDLIEGRIALGRVK
ncbi:AHH domain-containing protein [Paenibacillus sp. VTT E-133280]|uniref:AHH domain-containing protein n=1 Tax=Paenibacillus sp. VTT E-133280 TaxID=1986222 RepID=UPI00211AC903|nr:AHH domain-containing protein [Paenibacillus sp. VTT E-133280]